MSFTDLLLQAKAKRTQEFLFVVGSEPRVRVPSGWETLRSSPCLVTEWGLLQQSLLDGHQKAILETTGVVQGETSFENIRVGFSFFQNETTMKAVLNLDIDGSRQDTQIPASVLETCLRMKGLVLLTGPGEAGPLVSLQKVLQKMGEEKSFLGVVFSSKGFPQIREAKANFIYHSGVFTNPEERASLLASVDLVVFDGGPDDENFCEALALAERGVFVIYAMRAPSLPNALRRCLTVVSNHFAAHGAPRLAEVLSLAIAQYAMAGLSGERVYAHEVLLMKPQIREYIETENIKNIESLLQSAPENSGLLTLNQSLLQHLIRRRIDIKTAFESSRDPDALDGLLKKVGI